eukprot:CAMPEP_0172201988 /NCGR_PEP_ID=MMETSP1050-20130122/30360_1 /TAXON_ID=233186 /ORGANISM="Cryptomonas curvata, Strain CCAP979/52" /LENGTH=64 /DNA_ID=CAMNT_0012879805 /DNA_START=470 /DNA_END=664 /DNA_ORIENTATION=-
MVSMRLNTYKPLLRLDNDEMHTETVPVVGEYVPAMQVSHADAPVELLNVPGEQAMHVEEPDTAE